MEQQGNGRRFYARCHQDAVPSASADFRGDPLILAPLNLVSSHPWRRVVFTTYRWIMKERGLRDYFDALGAVPPEAAAISISSDWWKVSHV
jgi:hypothetical protein